jgi:hypothetical protein
MGPTHRGLSRTPPLAATWFRIGFFLALAVAAVAARAQGPEMFLVERIVVEGLDSAAARQIVVSESLLREGRSYSEAGLREAVYRVKRLPFVVDADMALRRGSQRGAYELAITVESAKPVAFSVEAFGFADDQRFAGQDRWDWSSTGTVSARKFVGPRGLLFGSMQGFDFEGGTILQIGYTQYGILRPGAYVSAAISSQLGKDHRDDFQASVQLGTPIAGNHAIRAGLARTESKSVTHFDNHRFETKDESWEGNLEWVFDNTDDPLIPAEGTRLSASGSYSETRFDRRGPFEPFDVLIDTNIDRWQIRSDGRRYWRVTPRQSLAVGGTAWRLHSQARFGASRNTEDVVHLEVTHAVSLLDFDKSRRIGDLRWENSLGVERFKELQQYGDFAVEGSRFVTRETNLSLRSALLFRSAWGIMRVSVTYINSLGEGW